MGESLVTCKASSEETGGQYALFEVWDAPHSGPPLHVHRREDESYYILEGDYEIHLPDAAEPLRAGAGAYIAVARGTVHTYVCAGPGRGRMLVLATPGGLERFFAELGEPAVDREHPPAPAGPPDVGRMVAIANKYGIEIVGPPPR
jgi:quercetin dioxygenase-like cupin family protein